MRQSWTDERLDDFRGEVNRRFDDLSGGVDRCFDELSESADLRLTEVSRRIDGLDARMERGFGKCEVEFQRINDRLDGIGKAIVFGAISLTGGILAGLGGMIVLMATQL